MTKLREEYGEREDFYDVCEKNRPLKEIFDHASWQRWEGLLTVSQPWLAQCPVDIDIQFLTAVALSQLGRTAEADEHTSRFRGLVDAILASGDGRTPETAYKVISIDEEHAVLRVRNLRPKKQTRIDGRIDAITAAGPDGEETVYFDPAPHFRRAQGSARSRN